MIIPITDSVRLRYEEKNYMAERRRIVQDGKNAGAAVWEILGYYADFKQAAKGLLTRHFHAIAVETQADNAKDLRALIDAMDYGADLISRACEGIKVPQ